MIVIKDEQTVTFQPGYMYGPTPWYERLFVLYLLAVLVIFLIRVTGLAVNLYKLRKARKQALQAPVSEALWMDCHAKVYSFKELCTLTLLISFFVSAWHTADVLFSVGTAKALNTAFVMADAAHGLIVFNSGLIVCIVLYGGAMFFGGVVRRSKAAG